MRRGPPEDCGGIPGFHRLLGVMADPTRPDRAELGERHGDYDPDALKVDAIQASLDRIARRRPAAKRTGKSAND